MATSSKFNEVTNVTAPTTNSQFVMVDKSTGALQRMDAANVQSYVKGDADFVHMYDNILIVCSGGQLLHTDYYSAHASSYTAIGVMVCEGDKRLVVALDETALKWSSAAVTGGGTSTNNRGTAFNDWNGQANTAAQAEKDACSGSSYAPGYCSLYSKVDSSGNGLAAGKWWLPSSGELDMIWSNSARINYALGLIDGATKLTRSWYWSSTEYGSNYAWSQFFTEGNGYLSNGNKYGSANRVRPVSAYW
jgi:hypothetical protein